MFQNESFPIEEVYEPTQLEIPIQYLARATFYTIIVSISTMYFGYSLTLISSSSLNMLMSYYQITMSKTVTTALLNGILPLGGIFGALITPKITPLTTKRRIHYFLTIYTVIACGISVIPTVQTVLIGRFLLGASTSLYLSVSAAYIKQTFPALMRKYLGAIYSCGRVLGILVCYLIATLSTYAQDYTQHIIVFFGPAYLSSIQAILVRFYLPDSVIELVKKNRREDASQVLSLIYASQNIERRLKQIEAEINQNNRKTTVFKSMVFTNPKNLTSLHLAVLRHFCGMSYIIVYAGQIVATFNVNDSRIAPTIINSVQLVANIIGIFLVQKFSRTTLLLVSCLLMGFINLIIGIADIEDESKFCVAMMCIFMIPCGAGLNSIVYSFPSQLVPPSQGKYTSAVSWLASATVSVVPPFVVAALPDKLAYPMFFFFALYLGVVSFINLKLLPEAEPVSKRKVYALKQVMM